VPGVQEAAPEVLTLQLPQDDAQFANFLDHVWSFDQPARQGKTDEDRRRGEMYKQESQRQEFKSEASSLDAFIDGLKLEGGMQCRVVDVSDRFGDYGVTGLVFFEIKDQRLDVDTLLLSCRVLGRGVEHALIAHLGQIARRLVLRPMPPLTPPTPKRVKRYLPHRHCRFSLLRAR